MQVGLVEDDHVIQALTRRRIRECHSPHADDQHLPLPASFHPVFASLRSRMAFLPTTWLETAAYGTAFLGIFLLGSLLIQHSMSAIKTTRITV